MQTALDQAQLVNPALNYRKLFFQGDKAAVNIVVPHMLPDFRQRKADFFHNQYGIQIVDLI